MRFEEYVICFFVYGFLGYLCEVIYCSIGQKKLVNRGYLYMPICPIYGYGAIIIILSMTPLFDRNMWYLVLLCGILLTSTLEYLTSYVMEILFHMRWWDYSKRKFNINGRVCLRNSLMFGALVMVVMYGIQPYLLKWIQLISPQYLRIVGGILLLAMIIDTIFSTIKNVNLSKMVAKISSFIDEASEIIIEKKDAAKEYLSTTSVALKMKKLLEKYPNLGFKKKGKKRLSLKEILMNHDNNKDKE